MMKLVKTLMLSFCMILGYALIPSSPPKGDLPSSYLMAQGKSEEAPGQKKDKDKKDKEDEVPTAPELSTTVMLLLGLGVIAWVALSNRQRSA